MYQYKSTNIMKPDKYWTRSVSSNLIEQSGTWTMLESYKQKYDIFDIHMSILISQTFKTAFI